jgi:hypothetical protein
MNFLISLWLPLVLHTGVQAMIGLRLRSPEFRALEVCPEPRRRDAPQNNGDPLDAGSGPPD